METIYVGTKNLENYLSACFYALSEGNDEIEIVGRGNNIKTCVDVSDIMLRKHIENPPKIPKIFDIKKALDDGDIETAKSMVDELYKCEINIGSEFYNGRNVSTISIIIRGNKKDEDTWNK